MKPSQHPNVIALFPEDRRAVVDQSRRGRLPRNVVRLSLPYGPRPGALARVKSCHSSNMGAVVKLIRQDDEGDWEVEGIHGPLAMEAGGFALRAWLPLYRLSVLRERSILRVQPAKGVTLTALHPATVAPAWWPFRRLDLGRVRRLTENQLLLLEGAWLYSAVQAGFNLQRAPRCINLPAPRAESTVPAEWPFKALDLGLLLQLHGSDLLRLEEWWIASATDALALDVVAPAC